MSILSIAQLEEFSKTHLWNEMKRTFLMRLSEVRNNLENPHSTREDDLINKGRAEELRFASQIVTLLIEEAKEDLAQEKEDEEYGS